MKSFYKNYLFTITLAIVTSGSAMAASSFDQGDRGPALLVHPQQIEKIQELSRSSQSTPFLRNYLKNGLLALAVLQRQERNKDKVTDPAVMTADLRIYCDRMYKNGPLFGESTEAPIHFLEAADRNLEKACKLEDATSFKFLLIDMIKHLGNPLATNRFQAELGNPEAIKKMRDIANAAKIKGEGFFDGHSISESGAAEYPIPDTERATLQNQ